MKRITVFTPTYNRGYCLNKLYRSLCKQTNQNFHWLVIDDGSNDNTRDLIKEWAGQKIISIEYIYQKNMGMIKAHNTAHENIHTELSMCVDSDDYLTENAIELVLKKWDNSDRANAMGIIGLDSYSNGNIIGDKFPNNLQKCTFSEIIHKYKIKGDKKYVLRSDLVKKHLPYPYFEGEKFPSPSYLYLILEQNYKFLLLNEVLCIVEYLPDGNSMNKIKQYRESPNAFAYYRIARMKYSYNYKDKFRNAIHYVSSKLLASKKSIIQDSPYKLTTILAYPFGVLLYVYIKNTKTLLLNRNLNKK